MIYYQTKYLKILKLLKNSILCLSAEQTPDHNVTSPKFLRSQLPKISRATKIDASDRGVTGVNGSNDRARPLPCNLSGGHNVCEALDHRIHGTNEPFDTWDGHNKGQSIVRSHYTLGIIKLLGGGGGSAYRTGDKRTLEDTFLCWLAPDLRLPKRTTEQNRLNEIRPPAAISIPPGFTFAADRDVLGNVSGRGSDGSGNFSVFGKSESQTVGLASIFWYTCVVYTFVLVYTLGAVFFGYWCDEDGPSSASRPSKLELCIIVNNSL